MSLKRGFQPTQLTQRTQHKERNEMKWRNNARQVRNVYKERNEMTSSVDRPITAASDDGVYKLARC